MKVKELIEKLEKMDQEKEMHLSYDSGVMIVPACSVLETKDGVVIFDEWDQNEH